MKATEQIGSVVELTVEKIVPNGYGLGFADGLTVFVPLSAVGDRLRVRIIQVKGKAAFAEIDSVIVPSGDRIEPPCAHYGRCGGCDFQHLSYGAQLRAKVGIVRDCLMRIGKIDFPGEIGITESPETFEYRSRATWHVDVRSRKIGFHRRNSHDVIAIDRCPVLAGELNLRLDLLRREIDWDSVLEDRFGILAATAGGRVSVFSEGLIEVTDELTFELDGLRFDFDARSFFQGNRFLVGRLVELATRGASGRTALDLYCGVGLFALPLARRFENVIGVEAGQRSIRQARRNAARSGSANTDFFARSVGEWLIDSAGNYRDIDFVLLDPPRAGTEKLVASRIARICPAEISYVSCEPSTLARDLRVLLDEGYAIRSIDAVDLFPQTHHVETVVRLVRPDKAEVP